MSGKPAEPARREAEGRAKASRSPAERACREPKASGVHRRPLVIAHRGASGERPENTAAAFEQAVAEGADWIETDLHRTRDGAIVLCHDADLRGLGGRGEVGETTLAEVEALDAGAGERVPTLDWVLERFAARVPFNLELKRGLRGDYPGLEEAALSSVRTRDLLGRVVFSSFSEAVLSRLRALEPSARLALLVSADGAPSALMRARALAAEALHPEASLVDAAWVQAAQAADLAVRVYTVDEPAAVRRFAALGVDALFTNYPGRVRRLLEDSV